MYICLVRHGETDWNTQGRFQGIEDIPLNENGFKQAAECGTALSQDKWHVVITSPLSRARQTALHIATTLNISDVCDDIGFIERDFGRVSGLLPEERVRLFPDGNYEDAENLDVVKDRSYKALNKCINTYSNKNIIIVSHGGTINALLSKLSNGEVGSGKTILKNTCINIIEYSDSDMKIRSYNVTPHEYKSLSNC